MAGHRRQRLTQRYGWGLVLWLCLVAPWGWLSTARAADPPALPGVLVMLSTGYGQAGIDSYVRGLYGQLQASGIDFSRIHIEYLDLVKNPQPAYRQQLAGLLAAKYPAQRIGVVVTMQPPALAFLLDEGAQIAPGRTVLVAQARPPERARESQRALHVQTATLAFDGTLRRALDLFPATRHVFVLSGNSAVEQERLADARQQLAPWADTLTFHYLDGLPLAEAERRLQQTPPGSVVIAPGVNRDGDGQVFVPVDTIVRISQSANAPVLPVYAVSIGRGALGGVVSVLEDEGKAMADSVARYLALAPDARADFRVATAAPVPLFDWNQLQRWGADWQRLPPDTRFLNRPPSLWEAYRSQTIAALLAIAVLTGLVVALAVQNRKRHIAERSLRTSQHRYQMLADNMSDVMWLMDPQRLALTYLSPSVSRVLGWDPQAALGHNLRALLPQMNIQDWLDQMPQALQQFMSDPAQPAFNTVTVRVRHADGQLVTLESVTHFILNESGQPLLMGVSRDVTQREQADQHIKQLAFYDVLTGLPNRSLLNDRIEQARAASARHQRCGAILFVDLDQFKAINDTRGHSVGDQLLSQAAERIKSRVRATDTVARLAGDEFVLVVNDLHPDPQLAASEVRELAEQLLHAFRQEFDLQGQEHRVTSSIGICVFLGDGDSREELLKRADLAMYRAKAQGRDSLCFFDPDMQRVASARAELAADMRKGLARQQFALHLQPQIGAAGQVTGAEALLRWQHPQRGGVSPAEFIALAEDNGFIIELGQWVLTQAGELLTQWARQPHTAALKLAVNVSPRQFLHAGLVDQVREMLARTGAPAHQLELELTESVLVSDVDEVVAKMDALHRLGVRFSLDDFGTGYSSLAYLKRLPLDQLKIDQSFVRDVLQDPNDALIVRTILSLGRSLGLDVISEGVETPEQQAFLVAHGCTAFQGYLYARPMPVAEWEGWLRKHNAQTAAHRSSP